MANNAWKFDVNVKGGNCKDASGAFLILDRPGEEEGSGLTKACGLHPDNIGSENIMNTTAATDRNLAGFLSPKLPQKSVR